MRKTIEIVMPRLEVGDNRDQGKVFQITEWSAATAEEWGIRVLLAINRSTGEIPMDLRGIGMEGIAILGINTLLRGTVQSEELIPLLNQLLDCVRMIRDPRATDKVTGGPVVTKIVSSDDIEEVATRLWLRSKVIELHTGFSPADALSSLISGIMTRAPADSKSTETSRPE